MCAKPETFEGFAENACNLFFPEIEKHNSEKLEPVNLIPFGFLQNHTYFNTIYFPRALEWKFIFDDNCKSKAKALSLEEFLNHMSQIYSQFFRLLNAV